MTKRLVLSVVLSIVVVLIGAGLLVSSWLVRHAHPWWSGTLDNAAVTVVLLIPGGVAVAWIASGFERVERGTEEVRATSEAALATAERAERSLEDVRQALIERQQAEHDAEQDIFRAMVRDPSRESLLRALRHATESGVITTRGVRAPVWETDLHYRFVLDGADAELSVQLEQDDGTVVSTHPWNATTSPDVFYQSLVHAVRAAGRDLGVALNDPTQSVQDLSEMLVEVTRHRAQALLGHRSSLRKIIERQDGWYFTENHILPADNLHYRIDVSRLDEMDWEEHLRQRGWDGAHSALEFARALYRDHA